jgi:hypothetical protein
MRQTILALVAIAALLSAPAAWSAPTCKDVHGETIRCATPGAMPVGWSPAPEDRARWLAQVEPGPSPLALLNVALFVGGLLALIALLPDFDSTVPGAWGPEEAEDDDG